MKQQNHGLVDCAACKAGAEKNATFYYTLHFFLNQTSPPPPFPVEPLINTVTELCQNQSKLTLLNHALCQSIQTVVYSFDFVSFENMYAILLSGA